MPTPEQEKLNLPAASGGECARHLRFMRRVRTALGHAPGLTRNPGPLFPGAPSAEAREILDRIRRRSQAERERLLAELAGAAGPINLGLAALKDGAQAAAAVARLVAEKSPEWGDEKSVSVWQHPLLDGLRLAEALAPQGVPVHVTAPVDPAAGAEALARQRAGQRRRVIESYIGVTTADFCLAETATLVMRNRPGEPRSVAVVPSIHIAVITLEQVIADMKELFALLRWEPGFAREGLSNYMSFTTGPSKTADIEATMVHGAHGPREVHLLVITGR
jgi:L-lactate dehydrogenase complex protein LldG